jgi:hypothetical protein
MAGRDFLVDINLNKNQLLNAKLQNLAAHPTLTINDVGFVYWDTIDQTAYFWTGTAWKPLGTIYTAPNHSGDIVSTGDTYTLIQPNVVTNAKLAQMTNYTIKGRYSAGTGNAEDLTATQVRTILNVADGAQVNVATNLSNVLSPTGVTINSSTGTGTLIPAADTTNAGFMTKAMFDRLQLTTLTTDYTAYTVLAKQATAIGAITIATDNALGRVAGNIQAVNVLSDLSVVIANNDSYAYAKAIKTYVDNSVTGALSYKGGYDANTNTPDLDVSPSSSIKKGWTYTVTAAGNFFTTEVLSIGDMLVSEVDAPTTLANWTVVNKNIPDIVASSEIIAGLTRYATTAEVTGGTINTAAITPFHLTDITKIGTITTGTWASTNIGLSYGGTNASLIASTGSIVYSTATGMAFSVVGLAGQALLSGGAGVPTWTAGILSIATGKTATFTNSLTVSGSDKTLNGNGTGITINGAYGLSFNLSGATNVTLPSSGALTVKYPVDITGNGVLTTFTVTHNLNTTDIVTFVKDASTLAKVEVEEIITNANVLTINFNVAPINGKVYRVTVVG